MKTTKIQNNSKANLYKIKDTSSKKVLIFVHGFNGNHFKTWYNAKEKKHLYDFIIEDMFSLQKQGNYIEYHVSKKIDNIFLNRRYSSDSVKQMIYLQIRKFNSSFKFQSTEEIGTVEIRLVNLYRIP